MYYCIFLILSKNIAPAFSTHVQELVWTDLVKYGTETYSILLVIFVSGYVRGNTVIAFDCMVVKRSADSAPAPGEGINHNTVLVNALVTVLVAEIIILLNKIY